MGRLLVSSPLLYEALAYLYLDSAEKGGEREEMAPQNGGANGAKGVFAEAVQNSYGIFADGIAAAQARNIKLALGWIGSSVEIFRSQAEINFSVMEAVAKQQEVSRTLVEESVKTFMNLAYVPLPSTVEPEASGNTRPPIDDFDRLTIEEIDSRLRDLNAREVEEIKAYEKQHKNRAMLMERLDRALV